MKIIELKIDDESLVSGIDAVALVESPAIEQDFIAFNKQYFETYNDYPEAAVNAAKMGIKRNEAIDNECATQVGKVRAQQLANRESLTIDTIKRMRSFLIRQKDNYELAQSRGDYNACGYISYLLWGGPAALPWAEKKLRQAGIEFKDEVMQFASEGRDIYLISCAAKKKDYACAACELYDSPLFEKSLSFARKQTEDKYIKILSAEYGLVDLDQVIEPYDKTLNDMSAEDRAAWADNVYETILDSFNVDKDRFVFLAGNAYTENLIPKFNYNKDLLEGMRIGERMEYLDKFYAVTNNAFYAVQHKFNGVEKTIIEELIKQEMFVESAMGLSVGDYVSWTYAGRGEGDDRARGQIKSIRVEGKVNIPDSDVTLNASEDRPVALIETRTGQVVGQFVDNLRKIQKPDDFEIDVTALPDYIAENTGSMSKIGSPGPNFYDPKPYSTKFASQLADKQMLMGPLMSPNKLIPRISEDGEEYFVYFTEDTIEKLAYKMMENKLVDSVNIEHDSDQKVDDVYLVETWLVKDPEKDKSTLYGYQPTKGEWFGIYKVKNKNVWDEYVKTGKVKGFSVEGYFAQRMLMNKL